MPILRSHHENARNKPSPLIEIGKLFSLGIVVSAFLFIVPASAEEECLHSRLWCYECDSWSDTRCKDPFNETLSLQEPALLQKCHGCCVKIVTKKGTPQETIKRTCTTSLQINLFLVDHVCMKESEGKGTMCFCESESCNESSKFTASWTSLLILPLSFMYSEL